VTRGLGSAGPRAFEAWPDLEFRDDRSGGPFIATVRRKAPATGSGEHVEGTTRKTTQKILSLVAQNPAITWDAPTKAFGLTADGAAPAGPRAARVTARGAVRVEHGGPGPRRGRHGPAIEVCPVEEAT
jgi:hypothetical protein